MAVNFCQFKSIFPPCYLFQTLLFTVKLCSEQPLNECCFYPSFQQNPKSHMWRIKQLWSWRIRSRWPVRHLGTQSLPSLGEPQPGTSAMKRRYQHSPKHGLTGRDQCSSYLPAFADIRCMMATAKCTWKSWWFPASIENTCSPAQTVYWRASSTAEVMP